MKTPELHVTGKWNLAQICTTLRPLICTKMRVAVTGRVGGIYKKPSKNVMKLTKCQIKTNKKETVWKKLCRSLFFDCHP